jgi:diketogulonate reductase-like aldo/keto reductase
MNYTIELNTGAKMPMLGLGLYKMTGEGEAEQAIRSASIMGYRLFDTASAYKNEEEVGRGIRSCGLPRNEVFVTTKIWNNAQRIGNIESAFERSLDRLGLGYVDLYLIHWPVPGCYLDTWHVLEEIYRSGRAKAIGVSNFNEYQLDDILLHASDVPAVNQIEYHPLFNQDGIRKFCQQNGIVVQAYAPLARGAYLNRSIIEKIAEKYNRSTAQIGLRWLLQKDICPIPKSVHTARILSNYQVFDFELDDVEMQMLDSMNENFRSASQPDDI